MKKIVLCLTICILLCNLSMTAYAAESRMQVNDLTAAPGELLYMTIVLEDTPQADTVGVQLTYDPALLEMVEEACIWTQSGEIQDFDAQRQAGVWTRNKPQDLNGTLCTIAFRVVGPKKTVSTTVDCTVILKVRSDEVSRFQQKVDVSVTCEHQFGDWSYADQNGHSQICGLCDEQQLQSHQWGNGVMGEDPDRPGVSVTIYTCQICKGEKKVGQEPKPTVPATAPQTPATPQPDDNGTVLVVVIAVAVLVAAAVAVVLWKKKK